MHYVKDRHLRGYERPGACNHWPVGQARCDGRTVQAADRPTHFLGFPISSPPIHEEGGRCWWNGLYGMTDLSMDELVVVARSWADPPELKVVSSGFASDGYDRGQRAYVLRRDGAVAGAPLKVVLSASETSPAYHPALVIQNWGEAKTTLSIDGEAVAAGSTFRQGHRHRLDGVDLIVWIQRKATGPISIQIRPSPIKVLLAVVVTPKMKIINIKREARRSCRSGSIPKRSTISKPYMRPVRATKSQFFS
jgi:hypothetical protein